MDRGAWRATVYGVAKSWTQLSDYAFTFPTVTAHCVQDEVQDSCCEWKWLQAGSPASSPSQFPDLFYRPSA